MILNELLPPLKFDKSKLSKSKLGDCFQGFINQGQNSQFMSMFMKMWNCASSPLNVNAGVKTHSGAVWLQGADLISSQRGPFNTSVRKSRNDRMGRWEERQRRSHLLLVIKLSDKFNGCGLRGKRIAFSRLPVREFKGKQQVNRGKCVELGLRGPGLCSLRVPLDWLRVPGHGPLSLG